MKIVLTNDDGFGAPGLALLEEVCSAFGEIFVVAPDTEQSYVGHRVTTGTIRAGEAGMGRYRIGGTPADCTRIALTCIVPDADWLISGVNRGGNLGADTYISGTVAAAREAALLGRRAIAISQYISRALAFDWEHSRARVGQAIESLMKDPPEDGAFWNVNLPHLDHNGGGDVTVCPLDGAPLDVRYRKEGDSYVFIGEYPRRRPAPGTDVDLCFRGHITATKLCVR
ncbi:MAG: 5'/3'-nucleotidase SurE [Bryobacterales bacterium]|nr:5'/3'-nucleotidase SurE [Bryobacterales bacterium]